jgi:hypothetical protein
MSFWYILIIYMRWPGMSLRLPLAYCHSIEYIATTKWLISYTMECVGHDKLSCSCIPLPKTTIFNELVRAYIYIFLFGLNQFRSFKTKATPHKPTIQYLDYMNELVQNHQVIWGLTSPFEPSIKRPSQSPPSIDSMCFLGTTIYGWVSWKIPI